MEWQTNKYHQMFVAGPKPLRLAGVLLQSYPLTRACLEILGNELLNQLQFGFFESEIEIIKQGETGKDLFLLCDNFVDVFVDGQKVVQMEAPALIGDKAIVEPNSKRSATIQVPPDKTCMVIKIPMGLFIRNFSDKTVQDLAFKQDVAIYSNLFQSIQQRLFDFIYLQKNLWEEVNTSLNLINTQVVAKFIDNKKQIKLNGKAWNEILKHLAQAHRFQWPKNIPVNVTNLRQILNQILGRKFPQDSFQGSESEYLVKKNLIWRGWLTNLSSIIVPNMEAGDLPIHIGEVELFNPKNYQLKVLGLIQGVQKKLESNGKQATNPKEFFGKGEQTNEFELIQYLKGFEDHFKLKNTQRTKAQITQKVAQIAASCENEFNNSIVKMQKFLKKAQNIAGDLSQEKKNKDKVYIEVKKAVDAMNKSFTSYNRQFENRGQKPVGEVAYYAGTTPTIVNLIKSSATSQNRALLDKSFRTILDQLEIADRLLPVEKLRQILYLGEGSPGYIVPHGDVERNYWIPVSSGLSLWRGDDEICQLEPGTLLGGKEWKNKLDPANTNGSWTIRFPKRKKDDPIERTYLIFIIPFSRLQWTQKKMLSAKEVKSYFYGLLQWMMDKQIEHFSKVISERDSYFNKWIEIQEVIKLENKVKDFETQKQNIVGEPQKSVRALLKNLLNMVIKDKYLPTSDILAKQIYNHILMQMKRDFPDLSVEERSNKTYTKWRYVISEIVNSTIDKDEENESDANQIHARPAWEILESEIKNAVDSLMPDGSLPYVFLDSDNPSISLENVITNLSKTGKNVHEILLQIQYTVEKNLGFSLEERFLFQKRLQEASKNRPQVDVESVQLTSILDTIKQLKKCFNVTDDIGEEKEPKDEKSAAIDAAIDSLADELG